MPGGNQSDFDCGAWPNGYTVCDEPLNPMPEGEVLVLMNVLEEPVVLDDPTNTHQHGMNPPDDWDGSVWPAVADGLQPMEQQSEAPG